MGIVLECVLTVLYDSFWPIILWLSPLLLLLSLSECLSMTDIGHNPLQRPIPPWPWELSCGLALPPDPPWKIPRKPKRKQSHFSFIQREHTRFRSARSWILHVRQTALDTIPWEEDTIPWGKDTMVQSMTFSSDPTEVNNLLEKLDPLEYYRRFSTCTSSSFLSQKGDFRNKH
jgi:hypothetical protein